MSILGQSSIFDMIQSAYSARALFVLVKIGVFESLAARPMTVAELAKACGAQKAILEDMLHFAEALKFLRAKEGRWHVAKKGLQLTKLSGSWVRPYLLVWGDQLDPAFAHLQGYVLTGEDAFKAAHGASIWDYYRGEPEQNEAFVAFMQGVTQQGHLAHIIAELDVGAARNHVDVAGGTGALACALAAEHELLSCTVCDQPSNRTAAERYIEARGVKNCTFASANIFEAVPAGRDLYTIKHVLHDWDDENATRILGTISKAMRPDSRLVIIEGLLDRDFPETFDNPEYLHTRNLEQRAWTPGRVRSSADFGELCRHANLQVVRTWNSNAVADLSYIECRRSDHGIL